MNFEEILTRVLEVADYPQEKRQEFVNTFYQYLYMRLVSSIHEIDAESADKVAMISAQGGDTQDLRKVFDEISANPKVARTIEKVSNEVILGLVDDVAKNATEEQKQQILSSLPTSV